MSQYSIFRPGFAMLSYDEQLRILVSCVPVFFHLTRATHFENIYAVCLVKFFQPFVVDVCDNIVQDALAVFNFIDRILEHMPEFSYVSVKSCAFFVIDNIIAYDDHVLQHTLFGRVCCKIGLLVRVGTVKLTGILRQQAVAFIRHMKIYGNGTENEIVEAGNAKRCFTHFCT